MCCNKANDFKTYILVEYVTIIRFPTLFEASFNTDHGVAVGAPVLGILFGG